MKSTCYLFILGLIFSLAACNLEQDIEITFPEAENRVVVECYLEANRPFNMLITTTAGYFDPFPTTDNQFLENILVDSAQVIIRHKGIQYGLANQVVFDFSSRQVFNYHSSQLVPADFDSDFELDIVLPDGSTITGVTHILPAVPLDSVVVEFKSPTDTLARVLTYFTDIPNQDNYYRRMLHESSLDSLPEQDFVVDDRFVEDSYVFGTNYDFVVGDTIFNTIFHLTKDHYNFLQSVENATNANGNPFAQPSPLISNLEGTAKATGVFTGLNYVRNRMVIER
ncbi:MAG: hypothetical protein DHS20C18_04620 [Saprospiraceae bacterium]|nr:MAG: hypothetical protein DHS20C18_04620 [Saprospiraceae bacterium]